MSGLYGPTPLGCSPYEWTLFGKCYPIASSVPGLQGYTAPATPPTITQYVTSSQDVPGLRDATPERAKIFGQAPNGCDPHLWSLFGECHPIESTTPGIETAALNGAGQTVTVAGATMPKWFLIAAGVGLLLLFLKR